ncbi:MAG: hypothetical protein WAK31_04435 [Chthoniobacterales bacterium]
MYPLAKAANPPETKFINASGKSFNTIHANDFTFFEEVNHIPRFQLLQRFQKQPTAPTLYYVFDILWHKGEDLTGKPILERRGVLERIIKPAPGIQQLGQ